MKCNTCDKPINLLLNQEMICWDCRNARTLAKGTGPTHNLCIRHPEVGKFPGGLACPKCLELGVGGGERVSQAEFDKAMVE